MKLLKILLSQLLIISLIFSGPTRADSEEPKKNTPYKTVTIIIDEYEEEEEEKVEGVASASTIVKNQDSVEWSTTEIVTTFIIATAIIASVAVLFKYRKTLQTRFFSGPRDLTPQFQGPAIPGTLVQRRIMGGAKTHSPRQIVDALASALKRLNYKLNRGAIALDESVRQKMQEIHPENREKAVAISKTILNRIEPEET